VLYSQLMAKLKSENAIIQSDDLETSKFQNSLPECEHVKVGPDVFYTPPKYFGMCAPDTKYFNIPPQKKLNLLKNGSRLKCLKISLEQAFIQVGLVITNTKGDKVTLA
jgi:hypothetical protein